MDLFKPDRSYLSQSNETISLSFFIFAFISTQMDGWQKQRRKQKKQYTQQKQDKELKSIRWRESDVYCYSYFVDVSSGSPNEPELTEKRIERDYVCEIFSNKEECSEKERVS